MCELVFEGPVLHNEYAAADISARIWCGNDMHQLKGFYAGDGKYKVRFLPKEAGMYSYTVSGLLSCSGTVEVAPSESHGMVRANGQHFAFEDGTVYYPFGTTVYALAHQNSAVTEKTFETLSSAPFNKIRMCLFPKHYDFNSNEPEMYPFERRESDTEKGTPGPAESWDTGRPCIAFWDAFEEKICALGEMGLQVDLILFHPYDRWGFNRLSMEDNLKYLDYAIRRLAAYPFVWWSLANEYDLCYPYKTVDDFCRLEEHIAATDPYKHLLSCHNCFAMWDFHRPGITHVSCQTRSVCHVEDWYREYNKPVIVDECCYEGNLPQVWGCISGKELTARFWGAVVSGGYCTHGETFLDKDEVIWWAKGGILKGESPARIAFLKDFVYSLPGYIEPVKYRFANITEAKPEQIQERLAAIPQEQGALTLSVSRMTHAERETLSCGEYVAAGHVGDEVYLTFLKDFCPALYYIDLPENRIYHVNVIDIWEMTNQTVLTGVTGHACVPLPGKAGIVIAAFAE